MKARNILNSNQKIQLCKNFFEKNGFQNFLAQFLQKIFFSNVNFSKKIIKPLKTNFQMILNTENENYMMV